MIISPQNSILETFFANKEIKLKIKCLISHEIDIMKAIINCENLEQNDQIIIRFIDSEEQSYIKQIYKEFNYDKIFDIYFDKYICKEQIAFDVIIQKID